MSTAIPQSQPLQRAGGRMLVDVLIGRQLDRYPSTARRITYLAIVVLATVVLYYEAYVGGSVSPSILRQFGMSFSFYVYMIVVGNALGAFSSIIAGLADRWGRANMVAWGLGVTGLLTLFAIPHAPNKWIFALVSIAIGFVEGIILVATPALVRDFSPQLGRASAMGFWTLGPVVGSLVVAQVASHTLAILPAWQDQFVICGIVGLVMFVVAVVALKELSPQLRHQLMVSMRDRTLIELKARGLDVSESLRRPWRQMLHTDIVASAFAISVFLLIYYAAVGFFVIYFTTTFGFSEAQANGIGNWFWAFDAGTLIVVGIVSDAVRVRKPFMVLGALGAIAFTVLFATKALQPHTSYTTFIVIVTFISIFLAIAYAPWMASFTETVERRNPALTATGLAVWGWIIRAVVALSFLALPLVVSAVTPLVTYGAQVEATARAVAPELAIVDAHPKLFAELQRYPANAIPPWLLGQAVSEVGLANLQKVARAEPELKFLATYGPEVEKAAAEGPRQWQTWWWVCVGGEVVFIPLILLMAGRWDPRKARQDEEEHNRAVERELAALLAAQPGQEE